jgi:hypothetical protein
MKQYLATWTLGEQDCGTFESPATEKLKFYELKKLMH